VVPVKRDGRSPAFRIRFSTDGSVPHVRVVLCLSTGKCLLSAVSA
jgi:hypothetical protein